jgi:hypothetical protein
MSKRKVEVVPGASVGKDAGVFQERGPLGGLRRNLATIPENHRAPPTTSRGADWVRSLRRRMFAREDGPAAGIAAPAAPSRCAGNRH